MKECPFCSLPPESIIAANDSAIAFFDGFPISKGHTLIVPKRHVSSLFELEAQEQEGVWRLVAETRRLLQTRFTPDGFNVGLNDGPAAGQTVGHAHIHLIPRRLGDIEDPRGGVRWILPEKADYWSGRE